MLFYQQMTPRVPSHSLYRKLVSLLFMYTSLAGRKAGCQCEVSEEYCLKLSGTERTVLFSHSLILIISEEEPESIVTEDEDFSSYPGPVMDEETQHSLECIQANQIFPRKQLIREDENLQVPFIELHGESTEYVGRAEDAIIALSNYRLHIKFKESVVNS